MLHAYIIVPAILWVVFLALLLLFVRGGSRKPTPRP